MEWEEKLMKSLIALSSSLNSPLIQMVCDCIVTCTRNTRVSYLLSEFEMIITLGLSTWDRSLITCTSKQRLFVLYQNLSV